MDNKANQLCYKMSNSYTHIPFRLSYILLDCMAMWTGQTIQEKITIFVVTFLPVVVTPKMVSHIILLCVNGWMTEVLGTSGRDEKKRLVVYEMGHGLTCERLSFFRYTTIIPFSLQSWECVKSWSVHPIFSYNIMFCPPNTTVLSSPSFSPSTILVSFPWTQLTLLLSYLLRTYTGGNSFLPISPFNKKLWVLRWATDHFFLFLSYSLSIKTSFL